MVKPNDSKIFHNSNVHPEEITGQAPDDAETKPEKTGHQRLADSISEALRLRFEAVKT